jgi:MarR family transcriptional regulator, organic hydroperoxide resistance regulator
MTTTSAASDVSAEIKATLLSYLDALALAEPIQAKLWQLAEITLTQVQVLRALRDGPQTLGKLGLSIGLSPTSVTRVVDRLERRGLVSRRRDSDDRRLVRLNLEPEGERLIGEIRVIRGSDVHLAVEAMTSNERRRLNTSLRRLVELARASSARGEERE